MRLNYVLITYSTVLFVTMATFAYVASDGLGLRKNGDIPNCHETVSIATPEASTATTCPTGTYVDIDTTSSQNYVFCRCTQPPPRRIIIELSKELVMPPETIEPDQDDPGVFEDPKNGTIDL